MLCLSITLRVEAKFYANSCDVFDTFQAWTLLFDATRGVRTEGQRRPPRKRSMKYAVQVLN